MATSDPLGVFETSTLGIRGAHVTAAEFSSFREGSKLKVPGAALHAVGALIQQVAELSGNHSFAVFSSWLSPLVSRKLSQDWYYGTIAGHIRDACNGHSLQMLAAKSLWIFPMYGDDPPHWILGWIVPGSRTYHIFNSIPELSIAWAEPALLELGDTVYATLGMYEVDWESWKLVNHVPPALDAQMNGWDCGIFVIHAMTVLANGLDVSLVKNSETKRVRKEALDLVLANIGSFQPYQYPKKKKAQAL
ncbi:ULP-PROTEASE domain-containing protein [Mycena chlorophos]|uniref:ULP-PROTEASE domain-containing protein n=1 Tax=Mycena chlorophos TaxID=658473 RepID=A0A8H6TP73_MYCCL|nr:ULP-PROTEASE domain-containing protein [Mycena chlorophos]